MKQINLNNFKVITDNLNTYFKSNKIMIGSSVPTGGSYSKGDIIVNNGANADKEPMWVCVESGNPGKWEVVGAGGTDLVHLKNNVIVNNAVSEVSIGIDGFNPEGDVLTVYRNSVYMIEGVDYNVQGNKIVSLKGNWNAENQSDYKFTFEVLKAVDKVNPNAVVGMENLKDDVRNAIEAAGNIDLSGYQGKNDNNLATTNKTIVGAINELFQDVDNGKNLIATSIGNPLITGNSTFNAMSEAILGLRRGSSENETDAKDVLYDMMIEDGYDSANSEMTVDELIDLLDRSNIEIGDIKQIACGHGHTIILKNDGSVWSCGLNDEGQLGLDDTNNRSTFIKVTTNINNDVKQIACGYKHTFILKNDGSVWSCGYNEAGQLGLGTSGSRYNKTTFTQVTTNINNDVKQIACGYAHTFILKNDCSIWSCGDNNGQLGLGTTGGKTTFTKVTTNINNDVKQIDCGWYHTIILKNDGSVWCCGNNEYGQLGLGTTTSQYTFTQINNDTKQIACGMYHTFILKNNGSVWSCGLNYNGGLGLGSSGSSANKNTFTQVTTNINNDVKQIDCGYYHTIIIKNDGSLWSCGYNMNGQLGLGNTTDRTTFTKVTTNINNDVKEVICGYYHTFIIKNDSSVWCCGVNNNGQLGLNDTTQRNIFTNTNLSTPITDYDIDKKALYNYLLSNDIEVTENMDIGTMLEILVNGYINNSILGYENNLRIILRDEGVSVNNEDNMDSLITKVDEEFANKNNEIENSGGGLDIISATQLPATGKENQICVITDNPEGSFLITNIESDTNSNGFLIYNTNNTSITPISTTNGNVTQNYRISYVKQDTQYLATYIWSNGVWNVMTNANLILLENGAFKNTDISGGFNTGAYHTISDGSLNISIDTDGVKYTRASFKNQIDFTYYNTLKITLKASNSTSTPLRLYSGTACKSSRTSAPQVGNTVIATAKSSKQTLTLDITSWQGLGYLNLEAEPEEYVALIYVYYIELY